MFFWKKDKSIEIFNSLRNIKKNLKNLKSNIDRKDKSLDIIKEVIANIENAKSEILERANEEKEKPWIDQKFDTKIDELAKEEIKALDNLEKELTKTYLPLLEETNSEEDITYALDELLKKLQSEEEFISGREQKNQQQIKEWTRVTLKERLDKESTPVSNRNTSDGIKWSNIAYVARQLGGWIIAGGRHNYEIVFPKATQPIPLSSDVGSRKLADEILDQLPNFLPEHKLRILNNNNLRKALNHGDLLRVA